MKIATSLADAEVSHPSVVSIGNFDGLHLGHRKILKSVVQRAGELGLQSVAMTFSPHPIRFLAPFDLAFSRLSPEEFVRQYLIDGLKARSLCVGGNFNFGYRQRGTIQTLREFESKLEIIEVPPVVVRGTA